MLLHHYFSLPFDWNPPADAQKIVQADQALQAPIPRELRTLYEQHNGASGMIEDADLHAPRLMPLEEVQEFYEETRDIMNPEVRFFWTDNNSNYVGVYVAGPLQGCICLVSHSESNSAPRFRDVSDYLQTVTARPAVDVFDSWEFPTTYPVLSADAQHAEADWQKAQAMYARVEDHNDGESQSLASAMALTPYEQNDVLMRYLESPNFWVAERAVDILGARRYTRAKAIIERIAEQGVANAKTAAQIALKCWDDPEIPRSRPLG